MKRGRPVKAIYQREGLLKTLMDEYDVALLPDKDSRLMELIDSLPEEASGIYDTNELTPTPSVNIEDVARVQFASHAHVFDRKRKAVFDWEQFKEVAGIFYGFGKRDSLPEEPLIPPNSVGLEKEIDNYFEGLWPGTETAEQCNTDLHFTPPAIMRLASHFAEWGAKCKESLQVQETCKENQDSFTDEPKDLEEAANEYSEKHGFRVPYDGSNNFYDEVDVKASKEGFIAGAKWELNQGVKATGMISPRGIIYDNNIGYRLFLERYHNGDKVEVQIRKLKKW